MDIASLLGALIAVIALVASFLMEGGEADSVFLIAPIVLVVGGSIGVSIVGGSMQTALRIPAFLRIAFYSKAPDYQNMIDRIVGLAERARRDGVLSLEKGLSDLDNRFLRKALLMVVDGVEASALQEILHTEISCMGTRHRLGIDFFNRLGGFSPTLGILGTVLALVHTLGSVNDPENMAAAIASAFIATLWGVGMANMVYLPIADKLKMRHEDEVIGLELVAEGALAIQSGETPGLIRRRLTSFIPPEKRREFE